MFSELAEKRRSVKVYAARPVEAGKIDAIIEAALRSPTGRAARPWAFVVVTDKTLLEKLFRGEARRGRLCQGCLGCRRRMRRPIRFRTVG